MPLYLYQVIHNLITINNFTKMADIQFKFNLSKSTLPKVSSGKPKSGAGKNQPDLVLSQTKAKQPIFTISQKKFDELQLATKEIGFDGVFICVVANGSIFKQPTKSPDGTKSKKAVSSLWTSQLYEAGVLPVSETATAGKVFITENDEKILKDITFPNYEKGKRFKFDIVKTEYTAEGIDAIYEVVPKGEVTKDDDHEDEDEDDDTKVDSSVDSVVDSSATVAEEVTSEEEDLFN